MRSGFYPAYAPFGFGGLAVADRVVGTNREDYG
jgi:hypothetical protein